MHKNTTKNLFDLLQDSLGLPNKRNLQGEISKNEKQSDNNLTIQHEFLEPKSLKQNPYQSSSAFHSVVSMKLNQICYKMRTEQRDFDRAQLLELLYEDFAQRKSGIIAYKFNDKQQAYYDQINEIIKLKNTAKIVSFLILLSQNNQSENQPDLSEFGLKYLKKKLQQLQRDNLVLPNKTEYTYSEASFIDRDKQLNEFFLSYDDRSFENQKFKKIINPNTELGFDVLMKQKNRFNSCMFDAISSEKQSVKDIPTQVFGAAQRIQPQSDAQANPFNINFEIPPLPTLSSMRQQEAQTGEGFSFFSLVKNKNEEPPVKAQGEGIQWVSKVSTKSRSPSPNNKRILKQSDKLNKKNLIWNLLPHVNEKLLDHNLEEECGIQRLWEDECLDVTQRNMKITENGLLTNYKIKELNKLYKEQTQSIIEFQQPKTYTEQEIVSYALLMLQGVPSEIFELQSNTFTFLMKQNINIEQYSLNTQALENIFEQMMEAGSFFLHLREFTEYMSNSHNGGMILQNFVLAIQDFLTFYYDQVNNAWKDVEKRRQQEQELIFENKGKYQLNSQMTILELNIHMTQLHNQIRLLATICFTQRFIKNNKDIVDEMEIDEQMNQVIQQRHTYNRKSLLSQFEIDIDRLRNKVWLENFPKGAKLLTYLYKIILCCESDLQAIDLLRRIFQKSIEPLLSMINSFIFTGDFEDPHNEFFIEKIYRRGQQIRDIAQLDFLFKLTSQPEVKVPAFLVESASTIFKAGCSVHLLKKQGLISQSIDQQSLKEYYEISSSGYNSLLQDNQIQQYKNPFKIQQFDFSQQALSMALEFQINNLRKFQDLRQKHYEIQTQKLQQLEMRIVKQEEDIYLKQIMLIEHARQEFIDKRMAEEEAERKAKQMKKEAYMKEIQEQMEEAKAKKEKRRLEQLEEKEAFRKEQDEYEKKKKAIEEELKRQYLELMKENQKLGDMRGEQAKVEEALDLELNQIIQDVQQDQSQPVVVQDEQKKEDIEMEEPSEEVLRPEEQQLVNQVPEQNPLLDILNQALQKAESNLNQSQIIQEDAEMIDIEKLAQDMDNLNNQDTLKLDEIKIIQENNKQEEQQEESMETKIQIVNEIFIQPLFKSIFSRIDEKLKIEKKRQTWNKIRNLERFQQVQEKRSKWRYQEPTIPIRNKLNQIFEEFNVATNNEQQQSTDQKQNTYNAPVALALRQCVINVVKDQFKLVNKCMIHMLFRKLNLMTHLETLKKIFFCDQGDIISIYMQSIFNDDYESTLKENSLSFINNQFEMTVKMSYPDQSNDEKTLRLQDCFEFQLVHQYHQMVSNANFYFTAFNLGDYVKVVYKRKYPLDLVISDQCIDKYNSIFFFLLKLKRVNQILANLWKYLSSAEFRRLPPQAYNKIRRVQILRNKMHHFISMIEQYALTEVIQASWATLKSSLSQQTVFEDLIKLHNEFLDSIMLKCFIDKKEQKIMTQITKMFQFVLNFNKIVVEFGSDLVKDTEAFDEVVKIDVAFERYTQYLYEIVRQLAYKGQFKELFLRLDFNKFYDRESGGYASHV